METKKSEQCDKSESSDCSTSNQNSVEDLKLAQLARDQLLKEAKRGATRAETMGSQGWLKPKIPPPNKRFLQRTLASTLTNKKSVKSLTKDSSKRK